METSQESLKLIPRDTFLYFPADDQKKIGENKKLIRWVFEGNTTYTDFEYEQLKLLDEEIKKQKIELPETWKQSDSLKFLIACSFNLDKSCKGITEYINWKKTTLPIQLTPEILDFLNSGIMYAHGRDHRFKPVLYFNPYKLDTKNPDMDKIQLSMGYFLEYMIHNLLLPGQVERWIFVLDLKGMGITSLPVTLLKQVMNFLQNNFRSRLFKMYIMNSPSTIYFTWKMIKGFLEETTTQKINFSKESVNEDMWKHTNKSQIEQKFGGTAPNIEKDFWPPKIPSNDYFLPSDKPEEILISKEQYQKMYQDGTLKAYKVNPELVQ